MIKIKLYNSCKGRNLNIFEPLKPIHFKLYNEFGIELLWHKNNFTDGSENKMSKKAETSDFDYLIIGPADFVDKSKSLNDSVDWGLENLNKIVKGGDYFLWDGFDSTSLLGSYDVFEQSDAIYLLKNQLLKSKEDYNKSYHCGKWFFGESSEGVSYDIPEDRWKNIKLSGSNLGYTYMCKMKLWKERNKKGTNPFDNHEYSFFQPKDKKNIDVLGIYQTQTPKSFEHNFRNDLLYVKHRKSSWNVVDKLKYKTFTSDKISILDYYIKMNDSKIIISPYGQGEICYRDWEALQFGNIMIKPDMSNINTTPNIYVDGETYISCKYDWSDLDEKVDYVLSNYDELSKQLIHNFRKKSMSDYNSDALCNHWYNMVKSLPNVVEDN